METVTEIEIKRESNESSPAEKSRPINYPIHQAVKEGNLDNLKKELKKDNSTINSTDKEGHTPLSLAVLNNNLQMSTILLHYGADIKIEIQIANFSGDIIAYSLHLQLIELSSELFNITQAIEIKANNEADLLFEIEFYDFDFFQRPNISFLINEPLKDDVLPLHFVIKSYNSLTPDKFNFIKKMLENGADPNKLSKKDKKSALYIATELNQKDIVMLLLENGADANQICCSNENGVGSIALHAAIENNNSEIFSILIEKIKPSLLLIQNNKGMTALHIAVMSTSKYQSSKSFSSKPTVDNAFYAALAPLADYFILQHLLKIWPHEKLLIRDNKGYSAFKLSLNAKDPELYEHLKNFRRVVGLPATTPPVTPEMERKRIARKTSQDVKIKIEELDFTRENMIKGSKLEEDSTSSISYSSYAVLTPGLMETPEKQTEQELTPDKIWQEKIIYSSIKDFKNYLVKNKLRVNDIAIVEKNATLILFAIQCGRIDIAKVLSDFGANVVCADKLGDTAIHYMVNTLIENYSNIQFEEWLEFLDILIEKGVTVMMVNQSQETVLHKFITQRKLHTNNFQEQLLIQAAELIISFSFTPQNKQHYPIVDLRNTNGDTALHLAIVTEWKAMSILLIEKGANVNVLNNQSWPPLHGVLHLEGDNSEILSALMSEKPLLNLVGSDGKMLFKITDAQGNDLLHQLVKSGNSKNFSYAVGCLSNQMLALLEATNNNGETLLHLACKNGNLAICKTLLALYKDFKIDKKIITTQDKDGNTPLIHAAAYEEVFYLLFNDDKSLLQRILNKPESDSTRAVIIINPTLQNKEGKSALHIAAAKGVAENIKLILTWIKDNGKDVCQEVTLTDKTGDSPISYAVKSGDFKSVKVLTDRYNLKYEAITDKKLRTVMHLSLMSGIKSDIADYFYELLKNTSVVTMLDEEENSPLMYALEFERFNFVKPLLQVINVIEKIVFKNKQGNSPLNLAVKAANPVVLKLILEKINNIITKNSEYALHFPQAFKASYFSDTPLLTAAKLTCSTNLKQKILETLLNYIKEFSKNDRDAIINALDKEGNSAFAIILAGNNKTLIDIFLKPDIRSNIDLDVKNAKGQYLSHIAAMIGNDLVIEEASKAEIDMSVQDNDGKTPLHYAIQFNQIAVSRLLVEKGARFDLQDAKGYTPIHYLVMYGNEGSWKSLETTLNKLKGNDTAKKWISSVDKNRNSVLHLGASLGKIAAIKLIDITELPSAFAEPNSFGDTPLQCAIDNNQFEFANVALDALLSSNTTQASIIQFLGILSRTNKERETILHTAIKKDIGLANKLLKLLEKVWKDKTNTRASENQDTCLAIIEHTDKQGETILHLLISQGEVAMIISHLNLFGIAGWSVRNGTDRTPLYYLMFKQDRDFWLELDKVFSKSEEFLAMLTRKDSKFEHTAFHIAMSAGNIHAITFLIKYNAISLELDSEEVNPVDLALKTYGIEFFTQILHIAIKENPDAAINLIKIFNLSMEGGSDQAKRMQLLAAMNGVDKHGNTALHLAILAIKKDERYKAVAHQLIDAGAACDVKNGKGKTSVDLIRDQKLVEEFKTKIPELLEVVRTRSFSFS